MLKKLFSSIAVVAVIFFAFSCSDESNPVNSTPSNPIVGTWENSQTAMGFPSTETRTLKADSTFEIVWAIAGFAMNKAIGRWIATTDTVILTKTKCQKANEDDAGFTDITCEVNVLKIAIKITGNTWVMPDETDGDLTFIKK